MFETILYYEIGDFFKNTISSTGATFWIALMFIAIIVLLLVKINSPAPLTLMVSIILFAVIGGFSNFWLEVNMNPISSVFTPIFFLILLITGGIFAYALWRMFGGQ